MDTSTGKGDHLSLAGCGIGDASPADGLAAPAGVGDGPNPAGEGQTPAGDSEAAAAETLVVAVVEQEGRWKVAQFGV